MWTGPMGITAGWVWSRQECCDLVGLCLLDVIQWKQTI